MLDCDLDEFKDVDLPKNFNLDSRKKIGISIRSRLKESLIEALGQLDLDDAQCCSLSVQPAIRQSRDSTGG